VSFIVVPHGVTASTAEVWVGAANEPRVQERSVLLEYGERETELDPAAWSGWESYKPTDPASYPLLDRLLHRLLPKSEPVIRTLHYQRVRLERLEPRASYPLKLHVDGSPVVGPDGGPPDASVTTLPASLPLEDERSFTLLLGSCYYGPEDREGAVAKTYHRIPEARKPDVKVLCGDQVYLDNPWRDTTFKWYLGNHKPGVFRAMLFDKYVANWERNGEAGFGDLLAEGANYFCSDDHEFWNNAPNFGGVGFLNTLTGKQRQWWMREARHLFRAFQSPRSVLEFELPPLSVRVADTRVDRDPAGRRFMRDGDLRAVGRWIEGLQGPGVLAVGQPVLVERTSVRDTIRRRGLKGLIMKHLDRNLPDYAQYAELVRYIRSSRHSIVLLTGDVHFGRVTHGQLRPGSGARLVEVISSPMQAVLDDDGGPLFGRYREAPAGDFPGLSSRRVAHRRNHFATIEFHGNAGGNVEMTVRSWTIPRPGDPAPEEPETIFQTELA
jgi:hypothetical protein